MSMLMVFTNENENISGQGGQVWESGQQVVVWIKLHTPTRSKTAQESVSSKHKSGLLLGLIGILVQLSISARSERSLRAPACAKRGKTGIGMAELNFNTMSTVLLEML